MSSSDYFGIVDNQIINYKKYMPEPVDVVFHSRTPNVLFEDGGVTGDVNTDYFNLGGTINTSVSLEGTNISCSTYMDSARCPNVILSGDFEITYDLIARSGDGGGWFIILPSNINGTNFTPLAYIDSNISDGWIINYNGETIKSQSGQHLSCGVKITRVDSTFTIYVDDVFQCTKDITDADIYMGWKTHSASGRNYTFNSLSIECNKKICVYYDDNKIIETECNGLGDTVFSFDVFDDVYWTGYNKILKITSQLGNEIVGEGRFTVHEINGTLKESVEYIANYLAEILTEKGVPSTYDEGLTSLIYKVKDISGFNPRVKTNSYQNLYRIDGVYNGGYYKGFYNGLSDWEFTATIDTNNSESGFCLFAYPYSGSYCNCGETNPWDCIYKNGRGDILQFKDGYIKTNTGSNLVSTGIRYSYSSSLNVKFVRIGNTINYFENDVFKGNYEWDALATAERIYPGKLNWVSTNRTVFSNLEIRRL